MNEIQKETQVKKDTDVLTKQKKKMFYPWSRPKRMSSIIRGRGNSSVDDTVNVARAVHETGIGIRSSAAGLNKSDSRINRTAAELDHAYYNSPNTDKSMGNILLHESNKYKNLKGEQDEEYRKNEEKFAPLLDKLAKMEEYQLDQLRNITEEQEKQQQQDIADEQLKVGLAKYGKFINREDRTLDEKVDYMSAILEESVKRGNAGLAEFTLLSIDKNDPYSLIVQENSTGEIGTLDIREGLPPEDLNDRYDSLERSVLSSRNGIKDISGNKTEGMSKSDKMLDIDNPSDADNPSDQDAHTQEVPSFRQLEKQYLSEGLSRGDAIKYANIAYNAYLRGEKHKQNNEKHEQNTERLKRADKAELDGFREVYAASSNALEIAERLHKKGFKFGISSLVAAYEKDTDKMSVFDRIRTFVHDQIGEVDDETLGDIAMLAKEVNIMKREAMAQATRSGIKGNIGEKTRELEAMSTLSLRMEIGSFIGLARKRMLDAKNLYNFYNKRYRENYKDSELFPDKPIEEIHADALAAEEKHKRDKEEQEKKEEQLEKEWEENLKRYPPTVQEIKKKKRQAGEPIIHFSDDIVD